VSLTRFIHGHLYEGVRAEAVPEHDVMITESAADICSMLASLWNSLNDLMTVSLNGHKRDFEQHHLPTIVAAYAYDVPSSQRFITSLLKSTV